MRRFRMRQVIGVVAAVCLACVGAAPAFAQSLPRGTIVDDVKCADDPAQSYALYLPSTYTPDRPWSLLLAFHAGARGRAMVEKYQAAAERYGYIVAGSNTSRNGAWSVSTAAVRAMSLDVGRRFSIDAQRLYLTGLSGGARVAMQVALGNRNIAGVIASSAGFPDSQPRKSVSFPVFGTTGTEDFNYVEMQRLDRALSSPHRLAVFAGGHTLPPDEVAMEAIEWLELQAMKTGRRMRDEALVDRWLADRRHLVDAAPDQVAVFHVLDALVQDFTGLRDVSAEAAREAALSRQDEVKKALARERSGVDAEAHQIDEILQLESRLSDQDARLVALNRLKSRLMEWSRAADDPAESAERSRARRLLAAVSVGAAERAPDPDYQRLIAQYGRRRR